MNKQFETIKKIKKKKIDDYRKKNVEEMEKFINEELSKLPIHQLWKQITLLIY